MSTTSRANLTRLSSLKGKQGVKDVNNFLFWTIILEIKIFGAVLVGAVLV